MKPSVMTMPLGLRSHSKQGAAAMCSSFERPCSRYIPFLLTIALSIFPHAIFAQGGRGYLEVTGNYKSGDFGTPARTDLYYPSSVAGYIASRYDFSLAVPYTFINTQNAGYTGTEMGLGDVILRTGAILLRERRHGFSLDAALTAKLPTADENKGLGTGEADFGAFVTLNQRLKRFKLSFIAGAAKIGDPPLLNYNDLYLYGIGMSKALGRTDLCVSFEGRRAIVSGSSNPQEIHFGFFRVLSMRYTIKGAAFKGLNKGGPDFGISLGFARWF